MLDILQGKLVSTAHSFGEAKIQYQVTSSVDPLVRASGQMAQQQQEHVQKRAQLGRLAQFIIPCSALWGPNHGITRIPSTPPSDLTPPTGPHSFPLPHWGPSFQPMSLRVNCSKAQLHARANQPQGCAPQDLANRPCLATV